MSKFLKILLYPVVFVVALLFFSVLLFPFDSVKNRCAAEIENAMGGDYQVSIGTLSPSFPSGAVLKNVEIRPKGDAAAAPIKLSEAKIKVAVMPLLSGAVEVDFDIKPPQGRASGSYAAKKGSTEVSAHLDRFDLGLISFLTKKSGLAISGLVSGDINFEIYPDDPLRNTGKALLQVQSLELGEISLASGFVQIPALKLAQPGADSKIDISINRGNVEVKSFQFLGGDLNLDTNGKVYGARRADNYRFNLKGSLKPTAEMEPKLTVLSLPDIKKQRTPEGIYPFTITGRLTKPSVRIGDFKLPIGGS
jgi:type II secretion system protein N